LDHQRIVQVLLAARTRISAAVFVIVRDAQTAEDVFQDVSVKALSDEMSFAGEPQLLSWAHITARHQALNWLRSLKNRCVSLDEELLELVEAEWARESMRPEGERMEALRHCVEKLPDRSRQLLDQRYSQACSCAEISRTVGVGLDAIYQRLARLHRSLRECIEKRIGTTSPTRLEA
jgi:RNA polymerase sigma-70 factor (ECF subfamily)